MKIQVEIECDTICEIMGHLEMCKKQIRAYCKENKIDANKSEFNCEVTFEHDSCYGSHELTVVESNWKTIEA